MKKTLIALAALAATGATFAQVTITGNLTSGYSQATTNTYTTGAAINFVAPRSLPANALGAGSPAITAGQTLSTALLGQTPARNTTTQNSASGFGVDNAEIIITAKEDIGGGQSVEAKLGLTNVARGGAPAGSANGAFGANDVTLTYTNTSIGRFQYGNTFGGAVFSGYPTAGAPVIDMDGKLFEKRSASEFINYAVPVGPITLVYQLGESGEGTGLGVGQSGDQSGAAANKVRQRSNTLLGLYREGPIEAFVAYKTYDNGDATALRAANGVTLSKDNQWTVQGAYDLGMAKVGFGYAYTRTSVGVTEADMLVGVNVPMGALEIGATWGSATASGIAGVASSVFGANEAGAVAKAVMSQADGTATGWSIGAKYNLSKRTHFKANYAAWTRSGYASFEAFGVTSNNAEFGYGPIETQANLLLSHSF